MDSLHGPAATSRRRLLVVVHGPFSTDPRVVRLVQVAVSRGFDVDVIAGSRGGEPRLEQRDDLRIFRIPIVHVPGRRPAALIWEYAAFTVLAFLLASYLAFRRRYRVIHINNPPDFLVLTALLGKRLGARVILDVHDFAPDLLKMRMGTRRFANVAERLMRQVERLAASYVDAVMTVHEPYAAELCARGVQRDKITIVLNSVDESLLPAEPRHPVATPVRVVYHGTINAHYGVEMLVDAVATARGVVEELTLELYGEGDAVESVRSRIRENRLGADALFHAQFLPLDDVLARVQNAAIGAVNNLPIQLNQLALPTKLFEYVALRVPVVAADLPTIRAYFADDEVRFFKAGSTQALAAALVDVARHPEVAAARAEAAYRRYSEYRWALNAGCYADLLERLAV
jgi:glycosyltransferase involved in cell wall biosynthesis